MLMVFWGAMWGLATFLTLATVAGRARGEFFTKLTIASHQFIADSQIHSLGSLALCQQHCQSTADCHGFLYASETTSCSMGRVDLADSAGEEITVWLSTGRVHTLISYGNIDSHKRPKT